MTQDEHDKQTLELLKLYRQVNTDDNMQNLRRHIETPVQEDDPFQARVRQALAILDSADGNPTDRDQQALATLKADPVAILEAEMNRPRTVIAASSITTATWPQPLLRIHGQQGAVLSAGETCTLAGDGGVAKSTLAAAIALEMAANTTDAMTPMGWEEQNGSIEGGILDVAGGPVLLALYEDSLSVVGWKLRQLAQRLDRQRQSTDYQEALKWVFLLNMSGRPLYGPPERNGTVGLYNARPVPLPGWTNLWTVADQKKPKLIVIDPALKAYTGEPNALVAVHEFLAHLAIAARLAVSTPGVLILHHSNKSSRQDPDPTNPGKVAGAGAWTDGGRGTMTMTWDTEPGARRLSVIKANFGPDRQAIRLETITADGTGMILGFTAGGNQWADIEQHPTTSNRTGTAARGRKTTRQLNAKTPPDTNANGVHNTHDPHAKIFGRGSPTG